MQLVTVATLARS